MNKIEKAFSLFDAYNQQDPNKIPHNGTIYPAAYFYALQLYNWVLKLEPQAGEALQLASRSQHIGRWQIPRDQYPQGKSGYYQWRTDLAKYHADKAKELMLQAGYTPEETEPVQRIILKKDLRTDQEVQVMENALCLVFLQFQYHEFIQNYDDDKIIRILRKTWSKMTEPGREAALTLSFADRGKELIERALS